MTPDEAREQFSAAYDGELAPQAQAAFDEALGADEALRVEWDEFRALLRAAHAEDAGDSPRVDLLAGVQRKLRQRSRGRFYRDRFSAGAGLGVMPLVLGLVILALLGVAWFGLHYLEVEQDGAPGTGHTDSR